jgi:hypothetical protein
LKTRRALNVALFFPAHNIRDLFRILFQAMFQKNVVSGIQNKTVFSRILENNPGLVIIKFGAGWCTPCTRIKSVVDGFFATSPDSVMCCDIDIDENHELYSFLKNKRMVVGVPSILCYKKGNTHFIPDDSVSGASPVELDEFFKRCVHYMRQTTQRRQIKARVTYSS